MKMSGNGLPPIPPQGPGSKSTAFGGERRDEAAPLTLGDLIKAFRNRRRSVSFRNPKHRTEEDQDDGEDDDYFDEEDEEDEDEDGEEKREDDELAAFRKHIESLMKAREEAVKQHQQQDEEDDAMSEVKARLPRRLAEEVVREDHVAEDRRVMADKQDTL